MDGIDWLKVVVHHPLFKTRYENNTNYKPDCRGVDSITRLPAFNQGGL